jgi:hypothetical protein
VKNRKPILPVDLPGFQAEGCIELLAHLIADTFFLPWTQPGEGLRAKRSMVGVLVPGLQPEDYLFYNPVAE